MLKQLLLGKKSFECSSEIIDILRLIRSENVGPKTFFALVNLFGNASIAIENIGEFALRGGRKKPIKICSISDANKELELLNKSGVKIVSYNSDSYSKLLCEISDFPPILSYKGNIALLSSSLPVAIVGARNASAHGQVLTEKLAAELVQHNYTIVSGLARGIDTAAHKASIPNTIAVLAGGIDHIYPPENQKLYHTIAEQGLIIAELPIGSKPLSQHFPQRNRLISGLSLGTVVIEATIKSGSLITAKFALEQNREVFAVPGFPLDPRSNGTNKLIKEGAYLVESAQDIMSNIVNHDLFTMPVEDLQNNSDSFKCVNHQYMNQIDDKMRCTVMNLLSATPLDFDMLVDNVAMPIQAVHLIILELELAGRIRRCPGNRFCVSYE